MKLNDMECPHDWNNCSECANVELCIAGLYKPNPNDHDVLMKAAKIAEEVVTKDAIESAEKIKGLQADTDFWTWWGRTSPPNINSKIPLPLDGPSAPGGGSKIRVKKSKTGNKPTVYVWGDNSGTNTES